MLELQMVEAHWYAVRVRSRFEKVASDIVAGKGYEVFLPLQQTRRRWSDRFKSIEIPLFPGYFFSRFDAMQRLPVLNTTGVVQILGSGDRLEPVDADEIEAIRKAVASGFPMQPCTFLKTGQRVHIHDGPLTGLDGIVEYQKAQCRLVLSVTLLQRSVTVEIHQSWVRPIPNLERPAGLARSPILQTYSSHF